MNQKTAENIVDHILNELDSYFELDIKNRLSDDLTNRLYDHVLKVASSEDQPIGMCVGGCKHPECLSIEYREEPGIRLVPYAVCRWCPDSGTQLRGE